MEVEKRGGGWGGRCSNAMMRLGKKGGESSQRGEHGTMIEEQGSVFKQQSMESRDEPNSMPIGIPSIED